MPEPLTIGLAGFGNHVAKNLLRLFDRPEGPWLKQIYVRDPARYAAAWPGQAERFTASFEALCEDPGIEAIYIATPISSHYPLARAALLAGKHVLCEKPLTWHLHEAEELAALAAERGLLLGEIAMYRHHAQWAQLRAIVAERAARGERLLALRARFTIPALGAGDIRYRPDLGGGALLDVGFYPLSAAVMLLGEPDRVAAVSHHSSEKGVDLAGQALLVHGDMASHCQWAIGAAYSNAIELSFEGHDYLVERAFSKPPELITRIAVREGEPIEVPADDQFANLLAHFTALIRADDRAGYVRLAQEALATARTIDRVRRAAQSG